MKEAAREKWADITKGLAIWLMVFCHANLSHKGVLDFIYIFHMPVFFLISGYFDKGVPLSFKAFKKTVRSLIRPYFIYSLLGLLICWISPYLHPEIYKDISASVFSIFRAAIIGMLLMEDNVTSFSFMPSGPLWFLVALFFIKLLWMISISFFRKRSFICFSLLLLSIFLIVCFHPNYFSLDSAVLAMPFFIVGFTLSHFRFFDILKRNKKILATVVIFSVLYLLTIGLKNGHVDIDGFVYGNNLSYFYLNGIIGSILCICISFFLQKYESFLSLIGRNSLSILGLHLFFCIFGKIFAVSLLGFETSSFPILASLVISTLSCLFTVKIKSVCFFKWLP